MSYYSDILIAHAHDFVMDGGTLPQKGLTNCKVPLCVKINQFYENMV